LKRWGFKGAADAPKKGSLADSAMAVGRALNLECNR
jgi:hypothetical protein